jgi:hypothetical protein
LLLHFVSLQLPLRQDFLFFELRQHSLTYKVNGKTVTESLPNPAAMRKAEREIAEFRNLQGLHKEFVEVNAQICQLRPTEPDELPAQEKKLSKRSSRKPSTK